MKRLLDTNAYAALKRGHEGAAESARGAEELVLPIVVVGELHFGFRNGDRYAKNLAELEEFLSQPFVSLQPVTWTTADRFGRIAAALRRQGTPIPTNDIWIAAHVQETGAELVTFDRHFAQVPGLPVLYLTV
jgi:tRNA(fMet)-specific endonuclease VapC